MAQQRSSVVGIVFSSLCLSNAHIYYPPAATTTTISSVCAKCVIIAKSGEISCCGHSGSWFGKCGRAGNAKLDHTWYEGIQACKKTLTQSKASIGRQSTAMPDTILSTSTHMSSVNTLTNMSMTAPAHTRALTTT